MRVLELISYGMSDNPRWSIGAKRCCLNTNDRIIRQALRAYLGKLHGRDNKVRIVEEFGVEHGTARVDIAVVNGVLHGYEIKSDRDTLSRLPAQMDAYNAVFDRVSLIVGKQHLYEAVNLVPDWWGISIAKIGSDSSVVFTTIREAGENFGRCNLSIARLLWRGEALQILEEAGAADGLRSKPRELIYERLSAVFGQQALAEKVRDVLFVREGWRSDARSVPNGG